MERSEEEIRHDEIIRGISEEARRSLLCEKLSALVLLPHKPLHVMQLSGTFPKLTIATRGHLNNRTPEERAFYRTSLACESVHELCNLTAGQSRCPRWSKERKVRIRSTGAHTILRTRRGPKDVLHNRMRMELVARKDFEEQHGVTVTEVGLFLHPQEPWLCGSPDGIFSLSG
ncbi:hypothetical protein MRX96_033181 [Rhipicephalus microplus]